MRKLQPEGPTPGRKVVRLLTLARRNPACCDVDKMPSPNFILTPSKDALGSYRELNPSNFLCVSVFIPKKHLSGILQSGVLQNESNKDEDELVLLSVFFSLYASDFLFLSLGNWKW